MSHPISRRSVTAGAAWAAPVLVVAAAAPAHASSCTPTSVSTTSAIHWESEQTEFTSDDGGNTELHTVQYTFTNNGPDQLPANVPFEVQVAMTAYSGEVTELNVVSSSGASAAASNSDVDNGDGTHTDTGTVLIHTTVSVPVGGTFTVTVLAHYGVLADLRVGETVTMQVPTTVTDPTTCTTYNVNGSIDGASNGTSYTS